MREVTITPCKRQSRYCKLFDFLGLGRAARSSLLVHQTSSLTTSSTPRSLASSVCLEREYLCSCHTSNPSMPSSLPKTVTEHRLDLVGSVRADGRLEALDANTEVLVRLWEPNHSVPPPTSVSTCDWQLGIGLSSRTDSFVCSVLRNQAPIAPRQMPPRIWTSRDLRAESVKMTDRDRSAKCTRRHTYNFKGFGISPNLSTAQIKRTQVRLSPI